MIKKASKSLKRLEVLITSLVKVFIFNKYNSYIHTGYICSYILAYARIYIYTARNATVTFTRNVWRHF